MKQHLRETVQRMLIDQTTIGDSGIASVFGLSKNLQVTLDGDPYSTATVQFFGTLRQDGQDWVQLGGDIALATDAGTHFMNGLLNTDAWAYVMVKVSAIAGTNARVNCWMLSL